METTNVSDFLMWLGRTSLEAGILTLLVLALQWIFRRQLTPRWRCALWLLVAARLLLPFSFSSAVSVFNLLPRAATMALAGLAPAAPAATLPATRTPALTPVPPVEPDGRTAARVAGSETLLPAPEEVAHRDRSWTWPVWVLACWLAGVLILAGFVAISCARLWRRCAPLPAPAQAPATAVLRECCGRLQLRIPPVLLESFEIGSPALHGLFRPRLLLPAGFAAKFSAAELRFVFLHELAHLKRRDLLVNWLAVGLQVMHWFNPLVWFAFARWRAERELACDAMALEAAGAGQNKEYGRTILRLLDELARPLASPGLVGILEDKKQLRRRIGLIASFVPTRGWPRLALLLMAVLAVVGLTDPQTGASPSASAATPPVPASSPAPTASLPAPAAPPPARPASDSSTNLSNPAAKPETIPIAITSNPSPTETKGSDMNKSNITHQLASTALAGALALAVPAMPPTIRAAETPVAVAATPPAAPAPAVPATSDLAEKLVGAWVLAGKPDHVEKAPSKGGRMKIFTGSHWCMTQADPKNGVVLFHHGGTYTLAGHEYFEMIEYADSPTINLVGRTNGHFNLQIDGDRMSCVGTDNSWSESWQRLKPCKTMSSPEAKKLTGTWGYAGQPGDTNPPALNRQRLKFCADGYWCDTDSEPKSHAVVIHHGGISSLKGDEYVETIQYANPVTMSLIGEDAKFHVLVDDHTLTLEGLNNPWKEVWKRLD